MQKREKNLVDLLKEDKEIRLEKLSRMVEENSNLDIQMRKAISKLENEIGNETKNLNKLFEQIGACVKLYYMTFTGGHVHLILEKIDFIYENISPEMQNRNDVKNACEALRCIYRIQSKVLSYFIPS
jgi:hypothetical protein